MARREGGKQGVSRNERLLELRLHTDPDRRWQIVTSLDLVAGSEAPRVLLRGDGVEEQNDQYQVRSDSAYLDMTDLFVDGLDVRIGRQVLSWGAADVFNPTDTLAAKSYEDPVKFGLNLPSPAVNIHYHVLGFDVNGIWVAKFQAPHLPPGLEEQFFSSNRIPADFQALADDFLAHDGQIDVTLRPDVPSDSLWGMRIGRNIAGYDVSVSYADTRENIPVLGRLDVLAFDPVAYTAKVDADLVFPRKKVYGADFAGQLGFLDDAGIWAEAAWTVPESFQQDIEFLGSTLSSVRALDDGYLKFTIGGDYTFRSGYLIQTQIVRGFIDENERALLDTYVLAGFQKSYFHDVLQVRLFETYDTDDSGLLVNPDLLWLATDHVQVGLGGLLYGGKSGSKFERTTTGDQYYLRLRYAF
ncbi:MAG: DUF1302 family protein [Acidobacteriota bacterium]